MIEIVDAGLLSTVQDQGRAGHAAVGVPRSGAVDLRLASHCNRLVGNATDAAVIETLGGLTLRAVTPVVVASDSEPVARSLGAGEALTVPAGEQQWRYVAVRGGIDVEPVLGSRSTDTLSGLGPRPLQAGDHLPISVDPRATPVGEVWPLRPADGPVGITPGPRVHWFAEDALGVMTSGVWTVGDASRVGVRLRGPELERVVQGELPSEGLVRGAIQVPPDGNPIMMLADHPTTGGYPVIAVVDPDDVATLAQRRAGEAVRFRNRR